MSTHRTRHLRVLGARAATVLEKVAVIGGGDAMRASAARDAGRDAADVLAEAGLLPVIVQTGPGLPRELEASGANLAMIAVLDDRLSDGSLQDICTALGIECLGAPATVARACVDKAIAMARMSELGVRMPGQFAVTREAAIAAGIAAVLPAALRFGGEEVFIKPARGSGGIAVKRVCLTDAAVAIGNTFNYDDKVIVQQAITGTELTVLMTGGDPEPLAVGVAEVTTSSSDSRAAAWARRWKPVELVDPSVLSAGVGAARRAAWALNLSGLTTVDVIVDGAGVAWVIDVDAMIDWRMDGAVPACLASSDLSHAQLIDSLLDDIAARRRRVA